MFLGKFFGETEQAAGILSNQIFTLFLVFQIGISFAITPFISSAFIKKETEVKTSILKNALFLIVGLSCILFLLLYFSSFVLFYLGQPVEVVNMAIPFYNIISLSIIPLGFFFVSKQYIEGHNITKISMVISVGGNLLNILLNFCLITGFAFFPKLGYMGSCWATLIARIVMGVTALTFVFYKSRFAQLRLFLLTKISWQVVLKVFKNGIASGAQLLFEVAAFVICGLMCGSFGKSSLDAHGISMGLAAFTYMFTSGISGAATIRVANFMTLKNIVGVKKSGYSAFIISAFVMLFFVLIFLIFHNILPMAFTSSEQVLIISSNLLLIAALFQMFDGLQVTGLGILRGMEDVNFPTYLTFIVYWLVTIPLAWLLAFYFNLKVYCVWFALCISLTLVSVALIFRFRFLVYKLKKPE